MEYYFERREIFWLKAWTQPDMDLCPHQRKNQHGEELPSWETLGVPDPSKAALDAGAKVSMGLGQRPFPCLCKFPLPETNTLVRDTDSSKVKLLQAVWPASEASRTLSGEDSRCYCCGHM
jgi:hypothetical protein